MTLATAIAKECGIYQHGGLAMTGEKFRNLSEAERRSIAPRLQVLARSSPKDKQILVKLLKDMGETVANDGPALKMAVRE
jgi:Ca2+-transporting ATPase